VRVTKKPRGKNVKGRGVGGKRGKLLKEVWMAAGTNAVKNKGSGEKKAIRNVPETLGVVCFLEGRLEGGEERGPRE